MAEYGSPDYFDPIARLARDRKRRKMRPSKALTEAAAAATPAKPAKPRAPDNSRAAEGMLSPRNVPRYGKVVQQRDEDLQMVFRQLARKLK